MFVADPYARQERNDFDLWSVSPTHGSCLCTYYLASDHQCGGEILSFTFPLCDSPSFQVQNTTVL